jgi:Holliday junction resolvase-like predicted endonuclease
LNKQKWNNQQWGRFYENLVQNKYKKLGYVVLNPHEKGFPDLIAVKDGKIQFFIEVKSGKHKVHDFQQEIHNNLESLGFEVKVVKFEGGNKNGN